MLAPTIEHAQELVSESLPPNTRRSYRTSWERFSAWYEGFSEADPVDVTPETVALYLAELDLKGLSPVSLTVAYAGISFYLRAAHPNRWPERRRPFVIARTIKGAYQKHGRPAVKKRGILASDLRAALEFGPWTGMWRLRARAVLLVGFAGGFRRSELTGAKRANVRRAPEGLAILLERSKTDQQGKGRTIGIHADTEGLCPVQALIEWCRGAQVHDGFLFRAISSTGRVLEEPMTDDSVSQLVKDVAWTLGKDPAKYGAHSLRRGFCTQADKNGMSLRSIMKTTGHRSERMVLGYIEEGKLFENNASKGILR